MIDNEALYWVVITESDGLCEDDRGSFDNYDDAYEAFERAVHHIDEIQSTVDDYPLNLDIVQLWHNFKLVQIWQRPPWKTVELLQAWAKRHGHEGQEVRPVRFVMKGIKVEN